MTKWQAGELELLVDALRTNYHIEDALVRASGTIGRTITRDAAEHKLKLHGLASATSLLRKVPRLASAPIADLNFDDDTQADYAPREYADDMRQAHSGPPVVIVDDAPEACRAYVDRAPEPEPEPSGPLRRILFIPDTHRPYHDERAWQLMLKIARKTLGPDDIIIVLGDLADFYSVSSHDKDPGRKRGLEPEVEDVNKCLDELDALGVRERHFIEGNHEERLFRFVSQRAPELFNVVSAKDLFRIDARGWTWTPYRRHLKIGKLHITHDEGNAGAQAHIKARQTFGGNAVIGHTHRMSIAYEGNAQGEAHVGAMFGWLGNVDDIDYAHRVKALQWQLGIGLGVLEPNGIVHLQPIPFINYRACVDGEVIAG